MPSIIIVPRTDKVNKRGEVPLRLQIGHADWRAYVALGVRVRLADWNPTKREVRKSHRDSDRLNRLLSDVLSRAQAALIDLRIEARSITVDRIRVAVAEALKPQPAADDDFLVFARGRLDVYERREQYARKDTLRVVLDRLEAYHRSLHKRGTIRVRHITVSYIEGFETFLIESCRYAPSTIAKTLKGLRTLLRAAMRQGLMTREQDPFFHIQIRERSARKNRLSVSELNAIVALELEKGSPPWHVRNYFMFAHYMAGIRFGDLARLRWKDIRRVGAQHKMTYTMAKTGEVRELTLFPPARRILSHYEESDAQPEDYIFPLLNGYDTETSQKERRAIHSQNTMVNQRLKEIQELAGIETPITFHMARHSFADRARKAGWSLHTIKDALGHANLAVTERYLAGFDSDVLDQKMGELFGDERGADPDDRQRMRPSSNQRSISSKRKYSSLPLFE